MTKQELINAIAADHDDLTKSKVADVVASLFDTVSGALGKGDKVAWPGFGSFTVAERAARKGRNPQTGAPINIPATKVVKFRAASKLKDSL